MNSWSQFERAAKAAVGLLERLIEVVIMVCLTAMMASLFWQVFSRFVIEVPATWTEEAARYAFIYMAFFGAALGVKRSAHFGVTLFTHKLSGAARRRYYRYAINLPILAASLALLVYGASYMMQFGFSRISPTFHFPMAWIYLVVPLSAAPMSVFAAYNVIFGEPPTDRDPELASLPRGGS
jgi:TRAP-type C4-dicarboxylate transport system permease small subunit